MADILIRGMKMPKEGYLPLNIYPDGRVSCNLDYDCARAVPLPEGHGRLIAAVRTIKQFCEKSDGCGYCDGYAWCVAMRQGGGLNTPNRWPDPEEGGPDNGD